jgi:hypothetical protein
MSEAKKAFIEAVAVTVGDYLKPSKSDMDHEVFEKEAKKWSKATAEFLTKCEGYGIWCRQEDMRLDATLESFHLLTPGSKISLEKRIELAWKHADRTMK